MKSYQKAYKTKESMLKNNDIVNLKRLNNQVLNAIEQLKNDKKLSAEFKKEYIKGFQAVIDL